MPTRLALGGSSAALDLALDPRRGPEPVARFLIDFDRVGWEDPAGDVGRFLATLRRHTLRQVLARRMTAWAAEARAGLADAFLREYVEAVGGASDVDLRRRIAWYEAVALERKALRSFARAPRSPVTRALAEHGQACLDRLRGTR